MSKLSSVGAITQSESEERRYPAEHSNVQQWYAIDSFEGRADVRHGGGNDRDIDGLRHCRRSGRGGSRLSPTSSAEFAGPNFAFDVERLELAGHVFSLANASSEPTARSYGLRGDEG
jgi:hypothetical protein